MFRKIFLITSMLFLAISVSASPYDDIDWSVYTNPNYASGIALEDSLIWMSTTGGIVRFNINDSTSTVITSEHGLKGNYTTDVAVDSQGNKWIGTKNNYLNKYYSDNSWRIFAEFEGIVNPMITAIEIKDNTLWAGTSDGASSINISNDSGTPIPELDGMRVNDIFSDNVGNVWFGTLNGIQKKDSSGVWSSHLEDYIITSISQDFMDGIWVGTEGNGIYLLKSGETDWISLAPANSIIRKIVAMDSSMWVATGKVSQIQPDIRCYTYAAQSQSWDYTSCKQGISITGNGVFDFLKDNAGNIWTATWGSGFAKWNGEMWHEYPINSIAGNRVTGLYYDEGEQELWLASRKPDSQEDGKRIPGGASRLPFGSDEWIVYRAEDGLYEDVNNFDTSVRDVVVDQNGIKWFTGWLQGVSSLDDLNTLDKEDDIWSYFHLDNSGLISEAIRQLSLDSANRLWVCSHAWHQPNYDDGGLNAYIQDEEVWLHFGRAEGIPGGGTELRIDCYNFRHDQGNLFWAASTGGLVAIDYGVDLQDKSDDEAIVFASALDNPSVNDVEITGDIVWIATKGSFYRLDHNGTIFNKADDEWQQISSLQVNSVRADPEGNIWLATDAKGLVVFNPDNWEESWTEFGVINSPISFNRCHEVALGEWTETEKEVFVATELGCTKLTISAPAPEVHISSVPCPNPFIPSEGHTHITFENLQPDVTVNIYNLAGELVAEGEGDDITYGTFCDGHSEGYRWQWDGTNEHGKTVASGVYIYFVDKGDGISEKGKIAIVR